MPEFENSKEKEPTVLSEIEIKNLAAQFSTASEFDVTIRLKQLAKQKGVAPEQILREVNEYKIGQMRANEVGEKRHFHRTSIENFKVIAEMGRMLSRSRLKKERPDVNLPGWSSSDNVMMTRDKFDKEGKLREPGFSDSEVVGASGKGIILVFREEIMNLESYDSSRYYPSSSDLPLEGYCEVILVNSNEDREEVEGVVEQNNLSIPVILKSEWRR